jgi:outer membrane protein assembly factor BamA
MTQSKEGVSMLSVCLMLALDLQPRVGNVMIFGNTITRDDVIRDAVNLYPGQRLIQSELREADTNLKRLGIFATASVKIEHSKNYERFKTILIVVKEMQTGRLAFEKEIQSNGDIVVRFIAEERNLDLTRWPRAASDFEEGRAFKGGGEHLGFRFAIRLPKTFPDPAGRVSPHKFGLEIELALPWITRMKPK